MPVIKNGLLAKDKTGNVSNTAKRMLVKTDMSRTFLVTVKVKKIDLLKEKLTRPHATAWDRETNQSTYENLFSGHVLRQHH